VRNFEEAPFLVIWEVTQACDLACGHCRASAISCRHPQELSTEEGFELLRTIKSFGQPLMVFTGGDPLKRPDLEQLLRCSVGLGLRTTVTPSATPLLTEEAVRMVQRSGVSRIAISLDGPDASSHDGFRRTPGSFATSLRALESARRIGLETQVNTTVTRHNVNELGRIAGQVAEVGARLWSVFFLIVTGRASQKDDIGPQEYVFRFLYETSRTASFDIKTTEAQHYRRYVAQRRKTEGGAQNGAPRGSDIIPRQAGINDGKGFVFVSHTGEIYPSGFLPMSAGNVRRDSLVDVYQQSPLFRRLRDPDSFEGKCGVCEFRHLCGGSRSRAFALTGDVFGSDPQCSYNPPVGRQPTTLEPTA
jgi:radical SAM protein